MQINAGYFYLVKSYAGYFCHTIFHFISYQQTEESTKSPTKLPEAELHEEEKIGKQNTSQRKRKRTHLKQNKEQREIHWNPDLAAGFMQIKYGWIFLTKSFTL